MYELIRVQVPNVICVKTIELDLKNVEISLLSKFTKMQQFSAVILLKPLTNLSE